jgi:hypothetical protein
VGVGETLGDGSREGDSAPELAGACDGGALPSAATSPEPAGDEADGLEEVAAYAPMASPATTATAASGRIAARFNVSVPT